MDKRSLIAELGNQRSQLRTGLDALLNAATEANRELTEDERSKFDADEAQIRELDGRIKALDEQIKADEAHAETMRHYGTGARITSEPEVYRRGGEHSYFRDVYRARNNKEGARESAERLQRNDRMVAEQRVALNTGNGQGGEFVPPLWLEQDFIKVARPGRIFANLVPSQPLPAGTDSINIPKISTGTATAAMTGQNVAVPETDLTTTSVASSVFTVAGGQTVSLQLIEQSPLNIDGLVLQDLAASYAVSLDSLLLTGSGTAGQPLGVMNVSGVNSVDLATPSGSQTFAGQLYKAVGNAKAQIHQKRYMPAEVIVMTPTRWEYLATQFDSSGRPLVLPAEGAGGTFNLAGVAGEVAAQGYMGTLRGLPVFADALIPTNLTADAGTGEDAIIVARISDLILWESDIRAEAFQQTYAQNMSVYVRLYNYASFQPARYAQSISIITGSGLSAPSFA
jgi:HK97 family phage major capsid protein